MRRAMVLADGVWKRYGRSAALRGCTLQLAAGEVVGLAGPNGAGKSTLARLIAGFERADGGTLTIADVPPAEFRRSRGLGYLPEELPRLRGWRVADLLRFRRVETGARLTRDMLTATLGIEPLLHKPLRTLSKGQLRLVCAAYALLGPSGIVILDEPDSGLDACALQCLGVGIRAAAEADAAVLMLSHHMDEMERLCDRVLFLFRGTVVAEHGTRAGEAASAREIYRSLAMRAEWS